MEVHHLVTLDHEARRLDPGGQAERKRAPGRQPLPADQHHRVDAFGALHRAKRAGDHRGPAELEHRGGEVGASLLGRRVNLAQGTGDLDGLTVGLLQHQVVHRSAAQGLVEPVVTASHEGQRRLELAQHVGELAEVLGHEELRLHAGDVVGRVGTGHRERHLAHLGREAVLGFADAREQTGPVEPGRLERADEAVLGGPPIQPTRLGRLRHVPHRARGGVEPGLGVGHVSRSGQGVLLHHRQGSNGLEQGAILSRGDGFEPHLTTGPEVRRVGLVGEDRRVPGALVNDVGGRRVEERLVPPDVRGDGQDAPRLELGEDRRGNEAPHSHAAPAQPREAGVHRLEPGNGLGVDARLLEPLQVHRVGLRLEVPPEAPENVPPHRVISRSVRLVVLLNDVALEMRGERVGRHDHLLARVHEPAQGEVRRAPGDWSWTWPLSLPSVSRAPGTQPRIRSMPASSSVSTDGRPAEVKMSSSPLALTERACTGAPSQSFRVDTPRAPSSSRFPGPVPAMSSPSDVVKAMAVTPRRFTASSSSSVKACWRAVVRDGVRLSISNSGKRDQSVSG